MTAIAALDEMVDGAGRLRPHWRGVLAGFTDHDGAGGMAEAARRIARVFEEEGITSLLPGEVPSLGQASWRCDPVPMVLPDSEFAQLAAGLAQRARLMELLLADLYGPQSLLADGTIPPALVLANPAFLRPCRDAELAAARHPFLHCYAADLLRAPDGRWHVVADRTSRAGGIGHALENRRIMARALPGVLRGHPVRPLRPFFELWQDALARLAPPRAAPGLDSPRVALLTPGVHHKLWFEHVLLARELSCALVEPGDLSVRAGAVYLKTLQGLQPLDVLLRRVPGRGLDPLEFDGVVAGIPGLLDAARQGTVKIANEPGAGLVEAPGLTALLPGLARRLLGEPLLLPQPETRWLADPAALAAVLTEPAAWTLRPATRGATLPSGTADFAARPRDWVASRVLTPSVVPGVQADGLAPMPLRLRLFLVQDGARWHMMPGGLARVQGAAGLLAKDVWVLDREESRQAGAAAQPQPPMAIRRAVGELPSRVADNLFWLGRYVERLEGSARLVRATLTRLDRGGLLPREQAELSALFLCLCDAGLAEAEDQPSAGTTGPLREALLRSIQPGGAIAGLLAQVARLVEAVRDRLTTDMYATFTLPLRALRISAQRPGGGLAELEALLGHALRYTASVAGVAAENMVRAGGYTFLDLGRRVERAQSIAAQLRLALAQPPARLEGGLKLALELCDSVITYRSRYLGVLQPAPALDLVLADPGNPRGLSFQLHAIRRLLADLPGGGADLADQAAMLVARVEALPAAIQASPAQDAATSALPPVLERIEAEVALLSDAVTRRYFALLPALQAVGGAPPEGSPGLRAKTAALVGID